MEHSGKKKTQKNKEDSWESERKQTTPAASSMTANVIMVFVQSAVELPRSTMDFNHSN